MERPASTRHSGVSLVRAPALSLCISSPPPHPPMSCSPSKRRELDVTKLLMSDWKVELVEDNLSEFYIEFAGPKESELTRWGARAVSGVR